MIALASQVDGEGKENDEQKKAKQKKTIKREERVLCGLIYEKVVLVLQLLFISFSVSVSFLLLMTKEEVERREDEYKREEANRKVMAFRTRTSSDSRK